MAGLTLRTKKLPGLIHITNHISYINHWTCFCYCKERVGLNGGGCCPLQFWQTHAVKFDELLKVCRTLTELRTALFKFIKLRESSQTQTFGRTLTEQPWHLHTHTNTHTTHTQRHIQTHVHTHIHRHIDTRWHMYKHVHTHTRSHTHIYGGTYTHTILMHTTQHTQNAPWPCWPSTSPTPHLWVTSCSWHSGRRRLGSWTLLSSRHRWMLYWHYHQLFYALCSRAVPWLWPCHQTTLKLAIYHHQLQDCPPPPLSPS